MVLMTDDQSTHTELFLSKLMPALRAPTTIRPYLGYQVFAPPLDCDLDAWVAYQVEGWNDTCRSHTLGIGREPSRQALTAEVAETRVLDGGIIGVCVRFVDSAEELALPPLTTLAPEAA